MTIHRFGEFELRPAERALLRGGSRVELGSRAFDVLVALVGRRERVVTKNELLDLVWPGLVVEENNLQVQVRALRRVLGQEAIATVPGRGYQFVLAEPGDASVAAPGDAPVSATMPVRAADRRRHALGVLATLLVLLVASAGAWFATRAGESAARDPSAAAASAYGRALSIAIAPFTDLSGDAGLASIAEGLASNVAAELARIRGVVVVEAPRSPANPASREPEARFLLRGDLQRDAQRLRVQASLVETVTGATLWTDRFEGDAATHLLLQDQVAVHVRWVASREMIRVAAKESEARPEDTMSVPELLLRARATQLAQPEPAREERVEALYRRALEREPGNVEAMAGLAVALHSHAVEFDYRLPKPDVARMLEESHELALRVKALDPGNTAIYRPIATYAVRRGDRLAARVALETAVALDPRNVGAHNNLALWYLRAVEPERALEHLTRARDLDPRRLHRAVLLNLGRAHYLREDFDAALEHLQRARLHFGTPPPRILLLYLALAFAAKGDAANAREVAGELMRLSPEFRASAFESPGPHPEPEYAAWFERVFLPAARKAGLPA